MISNEAVISEVGAEYEKDLVMPVTKPAKQFLLCPVGLVGAGKTTVVKPLAELLSLVRISGDEIRKLLKARGLGYDLVVDIRIGLIKKYLDQGYSVAVDSDCASGKAPALLEKLVAERRLTLIWIHINPPEEFIINKLKNLKNFWLFKDGDQAVENYLAQKPLHTSLTMLFVYTFDPSKSNLNEQIAAAADIITKKLALE